MNIEADQRAAYHHGDLRSALLQAALELVAQKGVEGFSLREAARAVGVSPAAAYRHFADKAALLGVVAEEGFARLASEMRSAAATDSGPLEPLAELFEIGLAYVVFAVRNPALFRVMFGPYGAGSDRDLAWVGPGKGGPYDLLSAAMDRLADAGVIPRERRPNAELPAWVQVHGLATLLVDGPLRVSGDADIRALFTQVAPHAIAGFFVDRPSTERS